ncbi:MAG: hypothetical protein AVDCRST_MAG41-313 [uncultured Corynebacteriales bacterium]|uniref:Uncharacterized protein n=1 Tax=uncultured Mycobacteriales bacterium TaxID=581187 RepID=A0A6J4H019_9ACTN|nr:MAG: hypothetical protein AVDCRST_MAG41-313 [uncultured Corynebacteriales bacterium]
MAGPALLLLPADGGTRAASAPPAPAVTGSPVTPGPDPAVFPVSSGVIDGTAWGTGAVRIGAGSARCVVSDDALGPDEVLCFDTWAGTGASWAAVPSQPGAVRATRLVGVAVPAAASVRILLDDGGTVTAAAVGTPVDGRADFFAAVVPGTRTVRSVTVLDGTGRALGPALTGPGGPPCRPRPDTACAVPK